MQVLGILVLKHKGGPLYVLCGRSPLNLLCGDNDAYSTACERIVRCVHLQELTYTDEEPVLMYFTSINK